MLFQYPDTSGKIDDFSELVKKAHDVKVCQKSCRFRKMCLTWATGQPASGRDD